MIVDADTHNYAIEIYEDFEVQNFYRLLKNTLDSNIDLDAKWKTIYKQVCDPSWPEPGACKDFHKLPLSIRRELKNDHVLGLAYISDDLETVHLDDLDNYYPSLDCQMKSGPAFCKTDKQVIIPETSRSMLDYSHDRNLAVKLMQHYNGKMLQICKENSNVDFVLWLAMQDTDACLQELEKYVDEDFFGIVIDDELPWAMITSAFPVFKFCSDHKIPVYFHANISKPSVDRLVWNFDDPVYVKLKKNWPFSPGPISDRWGWKINIITMITERIFDKLPDLRIVVAEKGLQWISEIREFMISQGWDDPLPYFQKYFWFTIECEESEFLKNAKLMGWDRLLFATDYPHNDPGGNNRFNDVDMLQNWVANNIITQEQYDQLTHKNYLYLKNRK